MKAMRKFYGKEREINKCKCGKEIAVEAKSCVRCLGIKNRKVKERPSKKDLLSLISEKSFTKIGELYGVSDNAIRRWCKDYDLPFRKKELNKLKVSK